MGTLAAKQWLNDEVINYFVELLRERAKQEEGGCRVYLHNTMFYAKLAESKIQGSNEIGYCFANVRRWTKRDKVDLFERDLVIVPINCNQSHWTLALINVKWKRFEYLDSFYGSDDGRLQHLRRYLKDEHKDKKGGELDLSEWTDVRHRSGAIPSQHNGFDCGMFMCRSAEYLTRGAKLDYGQQDMAYFRRRMVLEILRCSLLDEGAAQLAD